MVLSHTETHSLSLSLSLTHKPHMPHNMCLTFGRLRKFVEHRDRVTLNHHSSVTPLTIILAHAKTLNKTLQELCAI